MVDCSKELVEQIKVLEKLIEEANSRINAYTIPKNIKISVSYQKSGFQYYENDGNGKRIYIRKENLGKVKAIVQRDYDEAILKVLRDTYHKIERFLKVYNPNAIENVYNNLNSGRKALVKPLIPTDEVYIEKWKTSHIGEKNSYPKTTAYITLQGEHVRSKSEKIIADLFLRLGIIYCYEPELRLKNGKILYPDFALLNIKTRKTIYWEHFGLASNGDYASNALHKLKLYEINGFEIGKDIFFSMESEKEPLDIGEIEKKIRKTLL